MKNKFFRRAAVLTAALFSFTCMSATAYRDDRQSCHRPLYTAGRRQPVCCLRHRRYQDRADHQGDRSLSDRRADRSSSGHLYSRPFHHAGGISAANKTMPRAPDGKCFRPELFAGIIHKKQTDNLSKRENLKRLLTLSDKALYCNCHLSDIKQKRTTEYIL